MERRHCGYGAAFAQERALGAIYGSNAALWIPIIVLSMEDVALSGTTLDERDWIRKLTGRGSYVEGMKRCKSTCHSANPTTIHLSMCLHPATDATLTGRIRRSTIWKSC